MQIWGDLAHCYAQVSLRHGKQQNGHSFGLASLTLVSRSKEQQFFDRQQAGSEIVSQRCSRVMYRPHDLVGKGQEAGLPAHNSVLEELGAVW